MSDVNQKTVVVLVHGDVWGALNANQLLPELAKRNCKIYLIVSRSTPNKEDGRPANSNLPDLRPFLAIKENGMLGYFNVIDSVARLQGKHNLPNAEYSTFQTLAWRFCADDTVHYTTHGGPKGGAQIQAIFDKLGTQGVKPDLVLSGDTLAILPGSIVNNYPCFGTHPGPLPDIPGMHGTERSIMHHRLFNADGKPNTRHSLPHVKGSLFNLAEKLDDGPVIAFALSPYINGMTLLALRAGLYRSLIEKMIEHLDVFLDPEQRDTLLKQRRDRPINRPRSGLPSIVPPVEELSPHALTDWAQDGILFPEDDGTLTLQRNAIFDKGEFQTWMSCFWPKGWGNREFEEIYFKTFHQYLPMRAPPVETRKLVLPKRRLIKPGTCEFASGMITLITGSRFRSL